MVLQEALVFLLIGLMTNPLYLIRVWRPVCIAYRMRIGHSKVVEVGLMSVGMEQGRSVILGLSPLRADSNLGFSQSGEEG